MGRLLRVLGLGLVLAAPLVAQQRGDLSEARERWERMSLQERAEMRRRFRALERMDAGERRELERRAQKVRELEQQARDRLPEDVRTQLEVLGPGKRREIVRELTQQEVDRRGRDLLGRLPPELRERLEGASPEERRRILREIRARRGGPGMGRALDHLGERLGLPAAEIERLKSLPPGERERALLDLHARAKERGMRGPGAPGDGDRRGSLRQELERRMRADPEWRLELSKLSPEERRAEIQQRMKGRVLHFLEQGGRVTDRELDDLRRLEGREFFEAARKHGRDRVDVGERPAGRPAGRPDSRPDSRPGGRPGSRPPGRPDGDARAPDARRPGGRTR